MRLTLYISLVLPALCAIVIAIDLAMCVLAERLRPARSRRGVPDDAIADEVGRIGSTNIVAVAAGDGDEELIEDSPGLTLA